jgi:hypothetical protein
VSGQESVSDYPRPVKVAKRKPAKPHADYPFYAHASDKWAKKIRGVTRFFGPWDDLDGSLGRWFDQKDDLLAGRTPRVQREGLTIRDLINRFLTDKKLLLDTRELSPSTWSDYYATCDRLCTFFSRDRLVDDERLQAVTDHVRTWLFSATPACGPYRTGMLQSRSLLRGIMP